MAVDHIVSTTVKLLLEKSLSFAIDQIGLVFGFKKDLQRLRESAEMIQAILADAEDKQTDSRAVQLWLKRLQGVAYDAYYVLDELNYYFLRREVKSRSQSDGKVSKFLFLSKDDISFRWRMASKVRDINIKLKSINQEASEFGLIRTAAPLLPTLNGVTISRQTDSTIAPNVVGRDTEETRIVQMLLTSSEKIVSVIHITGMGGLGKTTLAKLVYNNQRIQENFNKRIWVCVSDKKYDGTGLFRLMLESLLGQNVQLDGREAIIQRIRKELEGKKYLLVLDDVWNDVKELWDDFFDSLLGLSTTSERSWCLVTSRKLSFAATNDYFHYPLGKLSDDDCWSILARKATADGEEVPEHLGSMRESIMKQCGGLPLAAKVLGSFLSSQRKEDWPLILEKRLFRLMEDQENTTMQILKLSFDYLPTSSIKKCFAYLSIFAKDAQLYGEELIELWMAEGFLQQDLRSETVMEKIGDRCLTILLQSSLLERVECFDGTRYTMHDLVHDLAQSVSKHESIHLEKGKIDNSHQVRYLALGSFEETPEKTLKDLSASVRTLFLESGISDDMISKFKCLHVLKLNGINKVEELPISVGKLKYLRYIGLQYSIIKMLPESLCNLYNLQTLHVERCRTLKCLPERMCNLISLRHLHYFNSDVKFQMPKEMGRLTCLQTLKFFNVGKEKGYQIEELGCFKDLRGELEIRNLELVNGKEGAKRSNLCEKPNLMELKLKWGRNNQGGEQCCDEHVLEGLEPHPNLRKLKIQKFMGDRFPPWFGKLSMLSNLELINCEKCVELPVLGHLPCLETIEFSGLKDLICIGSSFYGLDDDCRGGGGLESTSYRGGGEAVALPSRRKLFPVLKTLELNNMRNLKEWKEADDSNAVFPMLEKLTIKDCSQLTIAPTRFSTLKHLSIEGNVSVSVVKGILTKVTSTIESLSFAVMNGLTCFSDVVDLQLNNTVHLKYLRLRSCHNLTRLWGCGYSVVVLNLSQCYNLIELPQDLRQFNSLRQLSIRQCPRILHVGSPQQQRNENLNNYLTSLEYFEIGNCQGLISIASEVLDCCTSLKRLHVCGCPNLISFPLDLGQTPSLSEFWLFNCPKLFGKNNAPRGFGHLTSLRGLTIGPLFDSSVEWFDWSGLTSCSSTLSELTLLGLESVLPVQIQQLTALTKLRLDGLQTIEALPDWLGNLASLQQLDLLNCPQLQYLPSMPAMRRLTKLRSLEVRSCPLLKERCSPDQCGPESECSKISYLDYRYNL